MDHVPSPGYNSAPMQLPELVRLLQDPFTRGQLELLDESVAVIGSSQVYPRRGSYIDFVGNEVVGSSEQHYEVFPFETVDWTSAGAREEGVERELSTLLTSIPVDALVFDVGCGPGRISAALHDQGRDVVAIDLTRRALELLSERTNIPAIRADNLNLPVRDEVADLVISTGVVHHTPDPRQAIAENCRILKPGGTLYLRLFNRDGYYRFMYEHVGRVMRSLRRAGSAGNWIVESVCRRLYRLARRQWGQRRVVDEHLNALFENYFMKPTVTLMRKSEVDGCLATAGMEVVDYSVRSTMHCFIARKSA